MKAKSLYRSSAGSHFYGKEIVKKHMKCEHLKFFWTQSKTQKLLDNILTIFISKLQNLKGKISLHAHLV